MIDFIAKIFRKVITILFYLIIIAFSYSFMVIINNYFVDGNNVSFKYSLLGLIVGGLIGFITVIIIGGFFSNFLNMVDNIEKQNKYIKKLNKNIEKQNIYIELILENQEISYEEIIEEYESENENDEINNNEIEKKDNNNQTYESKIPDKWICKKCGEKNSFADLICKKCGEKVSIYDKIIYS